MSLDKLILLLEVCPGLLQWDSPELGALDSSLKSALK